MDENMILTDIKKLLSIADENKDFDTDIKIHINTALAALRQKGVGPVEGFRIETGEEKWSDFFKTDKLSAAVKDYIYIKVRLIFDTPQSGGAKDAMEKELAELDWRLNILWNEEQALLKDN